MDGIRLEDAATPFGAAAALVDFPPWMRSPVPGFTEVSFPRSSSLGTLGYYIAVCDPESVEAWSFFQVIELSKRVDIKLV
jgi:hypothetical protein